MATVLSTLYPPLIDTFMPAFLAEESAQAVFSISPYNSANEINKLHVSLVHQNTNLNAFATTKTSNIPGNLIDGIWILQFQNPDTNYLSYDATSKIYTLNIPKSLLRSGENFSTSGYYKLQLRFDSSNDPITSDYLTTKRTSFSEWSSVCLLKAIPTPTIQLTNFDVDADGNGLTKVPTLNAGIIPVAGKVVFNNSFTGTNDEILSSYSISIYNKDTGEVIDSIENVHTYDNVNPNTIYWLSDCTYVEPGQEYEIEIEIVTKNQYRTSKKYSFNVFNYDTTPFTPVWKFKKVELDKYNITSKNEVVTEEDGIVKFNISTLESMPPGFLYVRRASSVDNYRKWELLSCTKENGVINRDFEDMTVESLTRYRYSAQYQLSKGSWTSSKETDEIIYPNFYDMLFSRQDRQIAIRLDEQISSLKPVVNRQKIDTLGGKYPKFAENARMNYKQFAISGTINAESDFNRHFLNDTDYQHQMNNYNQQMDGKYQIRNDTIADSEYGYPQSSDEDIIDTYVNTVHDLYPTENWWWEREFREQAIEWLNDGEPKLFRSMTEGNLVVMLTDISLTPNRTVGRRIYNFSATMYEIEKGHSLATLNSLGIVSITNDKEQDVTPSGGGDSDPEESIHITTVGQMSSQYFPGVGSVILGSMATQDTDPERGFDYRYISVQDLYQFIYYDPQSVEGSKYKVVDSSIKLSNLKIQFESEPQYYVFSGDDIIKIDSSTTEPEDNWNLGYKIQITTTSGSTSNIFVNEKGYYQVPSDLQVTNLLIYDNATATLDYLIDYDIQYNNDLIPESTEVADQLVGQVSQLWYPGTYVRDLLVQKHKYLQYDKGKLVLNEFLQNWTATMLEVTPYSVVKIQFKDDSEPSNFIVGRTGIYNLTTDYPIQDICFCGRRMVQTSEDNYPYIDEWEFVLDNSAKLTKPDSLYSNLTWTEFVNRQSFDTDILVDIQGHTTTNSEEGIMRLWNNIDYSAIPQISGYDAIENIDSPHFNTVYGIKDGNTLKYMIYYIDSEWYEVSFFDSNQEIILAAVPVSGMVNYYADILRQTF